MSVEGTVENSHVLKGKIKSIPSVDKTLTKEGSPADAKAVGDAIRALQDGTGGSGGAAIYAHIESITNPHKVTARQVGLGNVDNTADMEKPVSTAQAEAIADAKKAGTDAQTVANEAKTSASNAQNTANNALSKSGGAMTGAMTVLEPTVDSNPATKKYVDERVKFFTATLSASQWYNNGSGVEFTLIIPGILATDDPVIDIAYLSHSLDYMPEIIAVEEEFAKIYFAVTGQDTMWIRAKDRPEKDIPIKIKVVR